MTESSVELRPTYGMANHYEFKCEQCEGICEHIKETVIFRKDSEAIFTTVEKSSDSGYTVHLSLPVLFEPNVVQVPVWVTLSHKTWTGFSILENYNSVIVKFDRNAFEEDAALDPNGKPYTNILTGLTESAFVDTEFMCFISDGEGTSDIRSMIVEELRRVAVSNKGVYQKRTRCWSRLHKMKQQQLLQKILASKGNEKINELLRIYLTGICSECTRIRDKPITDTVPKF